MVNSRAKGARLEREAAHALNAEFGVGASRSARNGVDGAADVLAPGLAVEVKGRRSIGAVRFLEQAAAAIDLEGRTPLVLMREDGGPWVLMVELKHARELLQRLLPS